MFIIQFINLISSQFFLQGVQESRKSEIHVDKFFFNYYPQ